MALPEALREQVVERAAKRCEYCLLPSSFALIDFEIDHVIAKQHGGEDTLDNLALACFRCNRRKGTNLSSVDPDTSEVIPLFNPRVQRWNEHFRLDADGVIRALTLTGRVTLHFLQFNTDERVEERAFALKSGLIDKGQRTD